MTEDEARKKWCPFGRTALDTHVHTHNRPDSSYNCIASDCMAWRWTVRPFNATEPMDKPYGYCGLAGKPE